MSNSSEKHTFPCRVVILGGGIAGMQAAVTLKNFGIPVLLIEKETELGGRVKHYHKTFPHFQSGKTIINEIKTQLDNSELVKTQLGVNIEQIEGLSPDFKIKLCGDQNPVSAEVIILATGFEPFDASLQEEYGYGVYPNVITGTELEKTLDPDGPTGGELQRPSDGKIAENIAIVFCVGSRSEKLGNHYCSKVCCSYSTKQAIEIKEKYPKASVTCFYIDIRTYCRGCEEMYRHAQEMGITYIRGRVGECGPLPNGDISIRAENTFLGKPVQGYFDLVSLSHGMSPCINASELSEMLNIPLADDGFFTCKDPNLYPVDSPAEGIFYAGAVTGLKPIPDCITDGSAAAARTREYLSGIGKV